MQNVYYRPISLTDNALKPTALRLADGLIYFDCLEKISRGKPSEIISLSQVPDEIMEKLTKPRAPMFGISFDQPKLMGILNVTPDSFSDGGLHGIGSNAAGHAEKLIDQGADILDIGGESTRPGAAYVEPSEEIDRTVPAIKTARLHFPDIPISIDTRKADVARAAISAGANLFNDVSALRFDDESMAFAAESKTPVCLMHSVGDPKTMQNEPHYDNVLLDVYDFLADRIAACEKAGIPRDRILVDPGIGFGKTQEHNLTLLRGLSLFHGLGCSILLGVSRKRFIGTIGQADDPVKRAPGSIAVALEGLRQGVQILRVHDIAETKQALRLWQAIQ